MKKENEKPSYGLTVVTGASRGIGLELARQFAQNGHDLLIAADSSLITEAAHELKVYGTEVRFVQCDLATPEGVEELYQSIKRTGRPVSMLALNAGVGVNGKFWQTDLDAEMNLLNLNVVYTVVLAKLVIQDMVEQGIKGKILITSSEASQAPGPYMAIYNASKAFVQSFAEALHYELKEEGISVTALMPDATDTNFFRRAGMEDTKVGAGSKDDPAEVARQGYEALMAGKSHVLAGSLKHRLKNSISDLLPEQTKARMYAESARPGSANDTSGKHAEYRKSNLPNAKDRSFAPPVNLHGVKPENYPELKEIAKNNLSEKV